MACYTEDKMHRHEMEDGLANDPCEGSQTSQGRADEPGIPTDKPVRKRDRLANRDAPPDDPPPDYLSYLVRLWRVGHGMEASWRASIQRPGTEEPIWFATLEELFAFLRAETGETKSG